jgi:transposase
VRRARVILLSAAGAAGIDIAVQLDLSPEAVSRIRRRFVEAGVDGLRDQPKAGRRDHAVPADTVEQILQLALSPPPPGRSRWTTRVLADAVGRISGCVSDILRAHGLKPHLVRTGAANWRFRFVNCRGPRVRRERIPPSPPSFARLEHSHTASHHSASFG